MTAEQPGNNDKPPAKAESTPRLNDSVCEPGCDCGKPTGNGGNKLKIVVCLVVAVAVGAILLFKATEQSRTAPHTGTNEFPDAITKTEAKGSANSTWQADEPGKPISAIGDLNSVTADLDTVFLIVPAKDNAPAIEETQTSLATVIQTLHAKNLKTGIFILTATSADYADVAAQIGAPGILVLTKGKSMGIATDHITEASLMQAYVASTSGGCNSGRGPKGCPTSAAPAKSS